MVLIFDAVSNPFFGDFFMVRTAMTFSFTGQAKLIQAKGHGWIQFFNGKDFNGWEQTADFKQRMHSPDIYEETINS